MGFALIADSSPDEFLGFASLDAYDLCGWNSSDEALSFAARHLTRLGFDVIVRMHPNTMNKSWEQLGRRLDVVTSWQVKVVFPWEATSIYHLITMSDVVVVYGSTVGLEAAAMGKPCWMMGPSVYATACEMPRWDRFWAPSSADLLNPAALATRAKSVTCWVGFWDDAGVDLESVKELADETPLVAIALSRLLFFLHLPILFCIRPRYLFKALKFVGGTWLSDFVFSAFERLR